MDGDVKFNRSWGQKITDVFRGFTQNKWGVDIKFDSKTDIENFIVDYNKFIESGNMTEAMANMIVKGADGKIFKDNTTYEGRKIEQQSSVRLEETILENPGWKNDFDKFTLNEDGSKKYNSREEFQSDGNNFWDAYDIIQNRIDQNYR